MHQTKEPNVKTTATRYETSQYGYVENMRHIPLSISFKVLVEGGVRYFALASAAGETAIACRPKDKTRISYCLPTRYTQNLKLNPLPFRLSRLRHFRYTSVARISSFFCVDSFTGFCSSLPFFSKSSWLDCPCPSAFPEGKRWRLVVGLRKPKGPWASPS